MTSQRNKERKKSRKIKKRDKYFEVASDLIKLWNMRVTVIPIVIGALGTVTKDFERGLKKLEIGGIETIPTIAWLRLVRIIRRVFEI